MVLISEFPHKVLPTSFIKKDDIMNNTEKLNTDKAIVVRANKLIESRHKMSMQERRFIFWNIAQVSREDTSFKPYVISVQEYFDVLGLKKTGDAYMIIKRMHDRLTQRNIGIEYIDKKGKPAFIYYPWFSKLHYEDGKIYSQLNLELKPLLLELKKEFTTIQFEHAMILDGYYAGRMYDLLAQYKKIGQRIIKIDFIKDRFQILDKYKLFKDFRIWVIEKPIAEINEKTDLQVSYKWIKKGRTNVAIDFKIGTSKPTVTLKDNREEQDEKSKKIYNRLVRVGVVSNVARNLMAEYSNTRICWHIDEYEKKKKKGKDLDVGWIVTGIKIDYRPQKSMFDDEIKQKLELRNVHNKHCQDLERLKAIISDIEKSKRISDIQKINDIYDKKSEQDQQDIEESFFKKLLDIYPDEEGGENFIVSDFRARKWKSLLCVAEMRQYWYEYNMDGFDDIADIAESKGIDYRRTLSEITKLKEKISDYVMSQKLQKDDDL